MEFKDYYKILGVDRSADQRAISQAFRKLARQYHPDVNPGNAAAEQRFKEINEAYQVLGDPGRRAKYDQLLDLRQRGGNWEDLLRRGGRDGGTFTVYGSPGDLGEFSEFFQQFFGDLGGGIFGGPFGHGGRGREGRGRADVFGFDELLRRRARGPQPAGQDVEGTVEISLEEAYHGTRRAVTVEADGGPARTIEVTIPRGVESGQRIRAAGQGRDGDLYLTVQIRPHPRFARQGDDVLCEVDVPVWVAALGGEVEVPTLRGPVTMKVPAGTHAGQTFRLRGQGMPRLRGEGFGDQLVKARLTLPHPLTPRDRELLEEMRRQHEVQRVRT